MIVHRVARLYSIWSSSGSRLAVVVRPTRGVEDCRATVWVLNWSFTSR